MSSEDPEDLCPIKEGVGEGLTALLKDQGSTFGADAGPVLLLSKTPLLTQPVTGIQ